MPLTEIELLREQQVQGLITTPGLATDALNLDCDGICDGIAKNRGAKNRDAIASLDSNRF
ncbi:MAG: hypothetical protein HC936_12785 [Leptolyngbyaceae cyanobacterium SU_3_3]|nr:hypothetical protein [Leptolyngbyaceae cyanobacterium SU_3_3]